jgi:hypothetical protein
MIKNVSSKVDAEPPTQVTNQSENLDRSAAIVVCDVFAGIRMLSGELLAEVTNTGRRLDTTADSGK